MRTEKKRQRSRGPGSPGKALHRRGAAVVEAVMAATVHELARAGFEGLSIDEVAARAGVNKTTVYRRWPTRSELVRALLREHVRRVFVDVDTGDVRTDLRMVARAVRANLTSADGRSVFLALTTDDPAIRLIARENQGQAEAGSFAILRRAIARGELPKNVDQEVLLDAIFGPLQQRVGIQQETVDDDYLARLVDHALAGAVAVATSIARRS